MSDNKCVAILDRRKMGHSNHVTSVAFHPTAPILVTGSWDNTVKMWMLSKGNSSATCVATLEGHVGHVTSVAFHPTAPLLATGSGDSITKVWDCMQLTDQWQRMRALGAMRNFLITKLGTDPSVHRVSQQLALENYSKRLSDATATNSLKLGPVADRLQSVQEFRQNKRAKHDGGSRRRKIKAKPKSVKRKRK
jgi:WD40 repeat protein